MKQLRCRERLKRETENSRKNSWEQEVQNKINVEQEKIKSENGKKKGKEIQSKTGLIVNGWGEFQEGIWLFLQY